MPQLDARFKSAPPNDWQAAGQLVDALDALIDAHNIEGQRLELSVFRARQRQHHLPRIHAVAARLARVRLHLPRVPANRPYALPFDAAAHRRTQTPDRRAAALDNLIITAPAAAELADPLEQFTASPWIEYDPNGDLNVSDYSVVASIARNDPTCYLYREYTAPDSFTHDWTGTFNSNSGYPVTAPAWAVSAVLDDAYLWYSNADDAVGQFWYATGANTPYIYLRDYSQQHYNQDGVACSRTTYYFSAVRFSATFTLDVYTDAARTNLFASLAVTVSSPPSYTYLVAANSYNDSGGSAYLNHTLEDLDLHEAAPPAGRPARMLAGGIL